MKDNWEIFGRTLDRRAEEELKKQTIPLRRRIDVILFTGIAAVFVLFAALWAVGVLVGGQLGLFDKPPIRPIPDERILTNVRKDLRKKPLLDAAQHREDQRIYISQTGGTVHSYHPATGLWKSEKPFSKDQLITPDLVLLRSGSGADTLSDPAGENPDPDSLWGLSAGHGLVRRFDGQWQTVIGDTFFAGPRGTPVKYGSLTSAAVSDDGKWLVVGTSSDGAGIYHLESRRWIPLKNQIARALPSHIVTHVTWWHNRFWIGGPSGLVSIEMQNLSPRLYKKPAVTGRILDLDVDTKNRLWVLEKRNCREEGSGCMRLTRLNNLIEPPERLVDEQNIYPELNPGDLFFAQYRDHRLTVAGHKGVFSYHTTLHSWQRHFKGTVLSTLTLPAGDGFYFGYTGGIGALIKDRYVPWETPTQKSTTWPLPNRSARIEKLRFGRSGRDEILGMTRSGSVFAVENGKAAQVFDGGHTSLDPEEFHSAFDFGSTVLFVGENGALVHDIVTRSYKDIPSASLPEWLLRPGVQLLASGDHAYVASPKDGDTEIYQVPTNLVASGVVKAVKLLELVRGPVGKLRDWGGRGMTVITGPVDGRLLRFTPTLEVLAGGDATGFTSGILDVAPYDNGLMAAASNGLRHYHYQSRSWTDYGNPSGSVPVEIAGFNGSVLTVTADGRLFKWDENTHYTPLIDVQRGFDIRDGDLDDVKEKNGKLYLAGGGKIYLYDPDTRQINLWWDLPGTGRVSIKGFVGTEPLALCDNRATVGKREIDSAAGAVVNLSRDNDYIWTVRQLKGERYLKRYPVSLPSMTAGESFFRNPGAGKGTTKIHDAVSLTDETVAVLSDQGLRFYSADARSWYDSYPGTWAPRGERLYLMDGFLVVTGRERTGYGITFVERAKLKMPPGISGRPVSFETRPRRVPVTAFTVDPQGGRVLYIDGKGRTVEWKAGVSKEILPAPGKAPETGRLRRVFDRVTGNRGSLLFTTPTAIHGCDLEKRSWREIKLNVPNSDDIDIRRDGETEIVTVKTGDGAFYLGRFKIPKDPARTVRVPMKQVFTPGTGFGAAGDRLLDVQQRGDGGNEDGTDAEWWTFLLNDGIKYFSPENREWVDTVDLRGISGSQTFRRVGNRGVLVDGGRNTWWVARQKGNHPRGFARYRLRPAQTTALDENGTVWRFTADGKLFKHPCPARGDYPANPGTLHEEPFIISPGEVKKAFRWGNLVLFESGDRVRLLDASARARKEIALPGGGRRFTGILEVAIWDNRLWVRSAGAALMIRQKRDGSVEAVRVGTGGGWPARVQNASGKQKVNDVWSQLRKKVVRLPDGQTAYDPITRLSIGPRGELSARRTGGSKTLAARGVIDFGNRSLPRSLDAGWIKWDRSGKHFEITGPDESITIHRNDFIRDGRFIFEDVDALLVLGEGRFYTANRHGIWRFAREDLSLTDSTISFTPMEWESVSGAAHGYFIGGGRLYTTEGERMSASLNTHRVNFRDVTVTEDIPGHRVQARVNRDGTAVNAFADSGFTWDRGKRGVFYGSPSGLLVQSDAGVHHARRYNDFKGELKGHPLLPGQEWNGKPEPGKRTLVDNADWTWQKQSGTVSVRLKENSYEFKPVVGRSGYGFSSDQLVDAVVFQNRLCVMTEAFFETVIPASQYGSFRASRFPSKPAAALDTVGDVSGKETLFLFGRAGNFYWDESSNRFKPAAGSRNPSLERLIAQVPKDKPFLRFTGRRGGTVKKEVKVKNIHGVESWVSFPFTRGRFPFDVVTAVAADNNRFYVGTAAGLLVSTGSSNSPGAGLGQMELLDLRRGSSGPLQAVTGVGTPARAQGLVIARSRGLSVECTKDGAGAGDFRACSNPGLLDSRLRLETGFWRFEDRRGTLYGRYKDEAGKLTSARIASQLGLFPHDNLKDIVVFDDRVFTLWQDGWVTGHPGLSTALTGGAINYNLRNSAPRRFILIPSDVLPGLPGLPPVTLPRGVYLQCRDRLLQYSGGKWDPVNQPLVRTGIVGYADRPPVVHRKNLVLSRPDLRFKRRDRDGGWRVVPWKDGRLALDKWTDVFYLGDRLWAATGEGLVTFTRDSEGRIVLDPDDFVVLREPGDDLDIPEVTDVDVDNEHNEVTLRCEASSNQVYRGTLTFPLQEESGIFQPLGSDPFAEREMVSQEESGFWQWHLKGRRDRGPGWLEGRFLGEAIRLFSGRFEFDTIHSLAFIEPDRIEIATDAGGWYRTAAMETGNTLDVGDLRRPGVPDIDYTAIKGVLITGEGDQRLLGLLTGEGDYIRWRRGVNPQKTKGCPEFLGNDGFWRYERSDGQLVITAPGSRGGKAVRTIRGGRFTDDIVTGLPVTGEDKGGIYYLVPTEGGVLGFDGDLGLREVHAGPFPGLKVDESPSVLFMDSGGVVLYFSGDGLRHLGGTRGVFPGLKVPVPEGTVVTAVEEGPQAFIRARWRMGDSGRRGWSLSRRGVVGDSGEDTFYVDISGFDRFIKNREGWGYPGPWMQVLLKTDRMDVYRPGESFTYSLEFPTTVDLLSPVVVGEVLYLIGERTLFEINLEHVMMESLQAAGPY